MNLPEASSAAVAAVLQLSHAMLDCVRRESPDTYAAADALMSAGGRVEMVFTLALEAPAVSLLLRMADGNAHLVATVPLKLGQVGRH